MAKAFVGLAYDVAEAIETMIYEGKIKEGDRLPPERELAEMLNVNRQTLRNAVALLSNEGILYTVQGKGTFMAPKKYELDVTGSTCLRDALASSPYTYAINNIYTRQTLPADYAVLAFRLDEDETIETQLNIIYVGKEPIAYETVYTKGPVPENTVKTRVKFSLSKSNEEESLFLGISKRSDVIVERAFETVGEDVVRSYASVIVGARVAFYKW